ncbi:hypothetical protein C518_1228 [Lysinibacillus fusiformis ZB2]|uniref:FRG domain-containing protein n=1 Tax=Lysinibacillus capsici TaxID=2115968 RepID=UPI00029C8DA4|nr:FRG domain-containing protein [Lysinibacillus capsici]EKU43983.1 hypothetical protein C518_1228 [Lysinibacillus fusiformis ZB2]
MDEILDNFFNQLYLNKYICIEDWLKKNNDIPHGEFWSFIKDNFEPEKYLSDKNAENKYLILLYNEYALLKKDIDLLSGKITKIIDLTFQLKPFIKKIEKDVKVKLNDEVKEILNKSIKNGDTVESIKLQFNIDELTSNILKNIFEDSFKEQIRLPENVSFNHLIDTSTLDTLLSEYNEKTTLKDAYFKKIYCLLIFSKTQIDIQGEKRTYIYYSNSEKIFIASEFITFQKLIKYFSDLKDDFQTPRANQYLKTLNRKIGKIDKYSTTLLKDQTLSENIFKTNFEPPELKSLIREIIELINFRPSQFSKENTLYYRGHSDSNYTLTPSIARNPKLIENENRLYHETIIRCNDFFQTSKHSLEILTLMQHYSIPTRLLDVSANPLSALYFTVCDNKDNDGEVIIFCAKENEVKYYHSDTVEILSTLSILNYSEKRELEYAILNIAKQLVSKLLEIINSNNSIDNDTLNKEIQICIESFNDLYVTKKLVHEIGKRNSHFQNVINPFHLYNSYFVLPIMNNSRITRQSGAFIITGLHNKEDSQQNLYNNKYHLPSSFKNYIDYFKDELEKKQLQIIESNLTSDRKYKNYIKNNFPLFSSVFNNELNFSNNPKKLKKLRIIIPSTNNKKDFSDWLSIFDINQATIYPEIEKVGEYLNTKYNK